MSESSALNTILAPGGITALYQPILSLNGGHIGVHGVECLSRGPRGTNFEPATVLFDYVRLKREESLVDRACVKAAFANVPVLPADLALSVNVHASTLGRDHGFLPFLLQCAEEVGLDLGRLTVEIVEHAPPWDGMSFLAALDKLRSLGVRIALDDVGLGESNFKMILDVCPDYLKLDRYFVDGCENDARRQAVISVVAQLARNFDGEVIAEGVSVMEAIPVLRAYGIRYLQGYLFAGPLTVQELIAFLLVSRERPPAPRPGASPQA